MTEGGLADWLGRLAPADAAPRLNVWGGGVRLEQRLYATGEPPPDALVSSVRAVVFRKSMVCVIRDPDGSGHVMPGGRRETGESQDAALVREIAEETGWRFEAARRFGFLHFRHLARRPEGYAYPYPDFFQSLHVVEAIEHDRRRIVRDQWETHSRMTPIGRALASVRDEQALLLRLAIAARTR
ncbi:MAG TPA: NUDIX domain-containing protein [Caulobacteraceae bacterium]|nr:NUDIX domain-containing protein [Caulobacteraceae bacterium]